MDDEEWRAVPTHDLLEASSLGRVRSREYVQPMPNGGERVRCLAPTYGVWQHASKVSRRRIVLLKRKTYRVARLVCLAFHGEPPPGLPNTLHGDEDPGNNRPSNLTWGTQKENLNAPGFIDYCRTRTGDNSPTRKGIARREGAPPA